MAAARLRLRAAAKPIKVDKATGPDARTVAEVVTGKAGLKDKSVLVRAQVVKVNTGIMGKNWLHLRDGSGSAADGSNDILVTTRDIAALGDVVSVKGTVRTDVNLGSGYTYARADRGRRASQVAQPCVAVGRSVAAAQACQTP